MLMHSVVMFATFALTSGLVATSRTAFTATATRMSSRARAQPMMGDIVETAAGLQGPVIFWGADGAKVGKEESDVKGYDNFGSFVAAVRSTGLESVLKGPGPYTVLVPTDAAFAEFKGQLTADILKYHVIEGNVPVSSIQGDIRTVQGNTLTYGRRFRKTFLDYAMVGIESSGASKGQTYPVDVQCSNGLIHAIDTVLVPGDFKPEA